MGEVEAGDRGEPVEAVGEGGVLEPGGEEAGGLGALSGSDDDEHALNCARTTGPKRASGVTKLAREIFVGFLQRVGIAGRTAVRAISASCSVQASRGVPGAKPGEVGALPQPVADGVGVHEQRPRGALDRATAARSTPRASRASRPGADQRQVDLLDQVPAGVAVAGQRPLGQQVVAARPGAARPASRPRRGARPAPPARRAGACSGRRTPGRPRPGPRRNARPAARPPCGSR